MSELTLDKALYLNSRSRQSVYEELEKIFSLMVDFQEQNLRVYQSLCEHKRDLSLADAVQALAQTFELLKPDE